MRQRPPAYRAVRRTVRRTARLGGAALLVAIVVGLGGHPADPSAAQAPSPSPEDYVLVDAAGGTVRTIAVLDDGAIAAGIGARFAVLDVTDRTTPRVIGRSAMLPATPRDVAAAGSTAFAALGAAGVGVIDLADRAAPVLAARLCLPRPVPDDSLALRPPRRPASAAACADADSPPVQAVGAAADGATAFAVGDGGLLVVDAADPYRPREAGWLPLGVDGRAVATIPGTLLVLGAVGDGPDSGNRLVVVDVRDPERPYVRSWLKLGGPSGAFVDLAASGTVAVAGGTAGAAVVDLTRLDRPSVAARIDRFVTAVDVRTFGGQTLAVLASDVLAGPRPRAVFDDIDLYDVTAPASPRRIGGHATATIVRPTGVLLGGVATGEPWFVLASTLAGCTVLERRDTGRIVAVGEVMSGGAMRVAASGGHAFVVEGDPSGALGRQRLVVVDLATGAPLGSIAGLSSVATMTTRGDRLYLGESNQGVRIVSTAVLTAPQTIGFITDPFATRPPAIGPGWLALVDIANTVHVLDARDPAQIRTLSALEVTSDVPVDVAVLGDRLLVAGGDRLFAFDLADPLQPKSLGQVLYDNDGAAFTSPRLAVGEGRAWVVDVVGGLLALDARPALPRRIGRFKDVTGLDVIDVGGRAIVRAFSTADTRRDRLTIAEAPLGGGGSGGGSVVGTWTTPDDTLDLASDPAAPGGVLVAAGGYGLTRWQRRADAMPTAVPTDAPVRPAPSRAAPTAVPPDPTRPHRAFLPLVTSALAGPKRTLAVRLTASLGGVAGAVAADGDFGYVTSGDRVVAYRLRGRERPRFDGPEALGSVGVGERIIALAVTRGRVAALVGRPRALEPVAFDTGEFGGGGQQRPAEPIPPGDGTALRLLDVTDPGQPRLAARVAVPPGAIDVAAGSGETAGWFAVVGSTVEGGYVLMVDARDPTVPLAARLDLGRDARPVGVAVAGRRGLVQLARGDASAVLLVLLDRPGAPSPGGTAGGLAAAAGVGGVAAARGRGFVLHERGLAMFDLTGREPRLRSEPEVGFNGQPAFVTALGAHVWAGTRNGQILQLVVNGDDANVFNFVQLPTIDAIGLGRMMAVGNGVIVVAGGLLGGLSAAEVPIFDPESGSEGLVDGVVFDGIAAGLGHSAAVAAGPPGADLAFATNAIGSVNPVRTGSAGGEPMIGRAFSFLDEPLPLPPTGLAIQGPLGALVGGRTPLRSLQVLGELVAPVAEPSDTNDGTALDALRASPTTRRIVLDDGFAWVAERNAGVSIFDFSEPAILTRAGRLETPGQPRGLAVSGGRVFVADGTAGLTLISARNPGAAREVGHLATPGVVGSVALAADGRTAFITVDSADGAWLGSGRDRAAVWAVDVRDMARPQVIGTAGLDMARVADAVLDGQRLYVAGQRVAGGPQAEPPGGTLSVAVVDVADVARPAVAGQWTAAAGFPYVPSMLRVVGTRVVVALGDGGLAVLDVR